MLGLNWKQWLISVFVGSSSLIVNFFLKFIPESICPVLGDEDPDDIEKAHKEYHHLRKTRDLSISVR
jgi:hypothetical protein